MPKVNTAKQSTPIKSQKLFSLYDTFSQGTLFCVLDTNTGNYIMVPIGASHHDAANVTFNIRQNQ